MHKSPQRRQVESRFGTGALFGRGAPLEPALSLSKGAPYRPSLFCLPQRTLVRERSAVLTFSALCSATPLTRFYSAKVYLVFLLWIAFVLTNLPARAAIPQTQEKPTEDQAQPADQPAPAETQPIDLSDEVVRDVLDHLQRGIETHDIDHVLGIFDRQNMKDFAQFQDQMVAFFRRYDTIRFRYQLLQVTSDKDGSYAIADIDMDADPSDILPTPQRRSAQMRFQLKRSPKGWKVVALKPADFFNQ
jgi:hypothetical protein